MTVHSFFEEKGKLLQINIRVPLGLLLPVVCDVYVSDSNVDLTVENLANHAVPNTLVLFDAVI